MLLSTLLTVSALAQAAAPLAPVPRPITQSVWDPITGTFGPPPSGIAPTDPVVYNNNVVTGSFYDVSDGRIVFDEGRLPSTSAPQAATQDSYAISAFEFGYVTRALDTSLGGPGAHVRISFYSSAPACADPAFLPNPTITFDLTGLPASAAAGTMSTHTVTFTPSVPFCLRADGDGVYSNGTDDLFVWSFQMIGETNGSAGPLVAGHPNASPPGNGTYYQMPGMSGTGLGSEDGFGVLPPTLPFFCTDFGGYPAQPFASFLLVARSPLLGGCFGCGVGDPYFENNDTCGAALPLGTGTTGDLLAETGDDDYYVLSVPANADVTVRARFQHAQADLALELYDAGCGSLLASVNSATDDELLHFFDCGGAARDLVLRVPGPATGCAPYSLEVDAFSVVDDQFEDNDTCSSMGAVSVATFTTPDLVVTSCDSDYFTARLQPSVVQQGIQITVDVLFDHDDSNVDLFLWNIGCTTLLASSTSLDDNESLTFTNPSLTMAMGVVIQVVTSGGQGWAPYDLTVCFAAGNGIGTQVCAGEPNSTGIPSTICAVGSLVATDNDVIFYVVELPSFSFGYFLTSLDPDFVVGPGGSQGNLCLGGVSIGRYSDDVMSPGAGNAVFFQPDLTMTPTPTALVPVVAGESRIWQYWHRDLVAGLPTSNFSGAICLDFQ